MANQGLPPSLTQTSSGNVAGLSTSTQAAPSATSSSVEVVSTSTQAPAVTSVTNVTSVLSTSSQASVTPTSISLSGSSSSPSTSSSSNGLSTGAVAGVAIGAALVGALLAFLFTLLIMRSRNRTQLATARAIEKRGDAKGPDYSVQEVFPDQTAKAQWEKHLPQPADDSSLRLNVKTLLQQIELHVETFYATPSPAIKMTENLEVVLLRVDSPHLPQSIAAMLPQVQDQTTLIKHCLANMILTKITSESTDAESFLPPDFTTLPQALQMEIRNSRRPGYNQAFSRWRVLTSFLRPSTSEDQSYLSLRDANIERVAETFCTSFTLWASTKYTSAARHQHLTQIMEAAADTGILMFSQPSAFVYLWNVPASARKSGVRFVVTPAFAKIADENSKALDKPYVMVPQVLHGF